jgi:hypothetical protein
MDRVAPILDEALEGLEALFEGVDRVERQSEELDRDDE